MQIRYFFLLFILAVLAACDKPASKGSDSLLLTFGDREMDVEPYQTRVIITPEFMRFDDGEGATDFLLFDRKQKTIYSVVQSNKSITIIKSDVMEAKPPFDLKLGKKQIDDLKDAPTMEGVSPVHHVYMSGEQICFEAISVPGFLPAYVQAMKEFNDVLAEDSKLTLNNLPADMHNGCNLARSIFAPNRHLQDGFPVQVWSPDGSHSVLLDFKKDYVADKTLFELPSSYQKLDIQQIRASLAKQKS